jgi:hypothetical protein
MRNPGPSRAAIIAHPDRHRADLRGDIPRGHEINAEEDKPGAVVDDIHKLPFGPFAVGAVLRTEGAGRVHDPLPVEAVCRQPDRWCVVILANGNQTGSDRTNRDDFLAPLPAEVGVGDTSPLV